MNEALTSLCIAGLPVFALLIYFWYRDRGDHEPLQLLRRVFILGILVIMPVAAVEMALQNLMLLVFPEPPLWLLLLYPFLFIALPEEAGKLWIVKKLAYKHPKFNELMDGITYCIVASMGFAMFENVMYTLQYGDGTGFLRAFTAVPAHALFSGLMGFYLGYAKIAKTPQDEKRLIRKALLVGVVFHGIYDLLLMTGIAYLAYLILPLLLYMAVQINMGIRLVHANRTQEELEYI